MMEKVIIMERKMPDLVERSRVEVVEQSLAGLQQRLTQLLEQRQEREPLRQSGSVGAGDGGVGGTSRVGHYGTVDNMASE